MNLPMGLSEENLVQQTVDKCDFFHEMVKRAH